MTAEDPQKYCKKIQKNMKLSGFFSNIQGLNYLSYQLFEAIFQQSVFSKLGLLFWSQDTPWFKNMRKLGVNFFYVFF